MKRSISLVLPLLFLLGCGSSSPSEPTKAPVTKGDTKKPIITTDKDGKVTTITLASGSADGIAVSGDALFIAKGKDGVDVVKIGYSDKISSEFITAIKGINAKSISLSNDGKKIYIENEQGYVNVVNIENLANPQKEQTITMKQAQKFAISEDANYKFIPKKEKGLEVYDISNPSNEELIHTFNKSNAYDIVLADKDTKALIASGVTGINLLDITDPTKVDIVANFLIGGSVKGLSLNKDEGILFVANGDNGVLVYNLNVILDMIIK